MLIGIDGNEANAVNRVGSGKYAFELLREFSKNKKHRFSIYLKGKPLPDLPEETSNFQYKVFGPKKLWTQLALPLNLFFGEKPDVFFSTAHYGPRFSKVPYVVTIHDLSYLHFPEHFKKNDLYQLTNWSKYSISNSKHIIVPSSSTKSDIVKNYKIKPSKITVTYEGYDRSRFKPQQKSTIEKIKAKYKIKGDYIVYVGTLQPRKNIERLIEAFAQIIFNVQRSTFNLVIVGKKGWLFDSIFQRVKDLQIERNVIFTDFVPDFDLSVLISGAKVYVNPSLWEGFGVPVIEAQACGVPVVVSNTSSLPEIVGNSGILVDPENVQSLVSGIQKVLNDTKTSSALVKKGFTNIKRFSWEKCAAQTLETLEKVASNRNP